MRPSPATIFWPKGCSVNGSCYGWTKPAICVIGVLEDPVDVAMVQSILSSSESWKAIKDACGGDPSLIGTCEFDQDCRSPLPRSLTLFGHDILEFSYVLYDPHNSQSLRFYAMEPIQQHLLMAPTNNVYNQSARFDFTRRICHGASQGIDDVVISQINASSLLQAMIRSPFSTPKLLPSTASILIALASHLGSLSSGIISISRILTHLTNISVNPFTQDPSRLRDVSAIVQQIDVRVEQATFFVNHVTTLHRRNTADTGQYSVRYTNFFNMVWLIMNDVTLGFALGTFLAENNVTLASYANSAVQEWLFDFPRAAVHWLDAWPAGLKLNAQLSRFYVDILIGVIDTWRFILPPITPSLFITLGMLASVGGLTLVLAVLSDLLSISLTAHLRVAYELSRAVYWGAGVKLGGGLLWGVFRGKRRNILRNRTDTWSYDIDQLLFGTVLFTLIAFLFPTALVYYVLFAGIRLATLLVQASIETLLAFMHHFPLFALMLRAKDPKRLPGGIYFTLRTISTSDKAPRPSSYLVLENQPIPLSAIFFQYIELWQRLARHYNPLRLLYQVLAGQHLSSIPRYSIRYAARPEPAGRG